MSDLAAIITAGVGALGTLGGGVTWLWARVEKRFSEVERKLEACERREADSTKRERTLEMSMRDQAAKHVTVIELLWQEIERRSRGAPNAVLGRARKLLDDLKEEADND
ncbi:MAG: hypothetical protein C0486_15010 [Erythrobacter sp.]|nr:hypothetical protein [Erythrobacter sp.]MBA4079653.1 hypothetical protein [Erythrobacter sp.]